MAADRKMPLWVRGEHTEGKHLVLEQYLKAWIPILGMGPQNGRIILVDGFAGPGEYSDGEEGSPVVAMRVLAEHRAPIKAQVVFIFIEKQRARARHLEGIVSKWKPRLPKGTRVKVIEGSFDAEMTEALDELDIQAKQMAPAFVMLDPFGVKGIPMQVIRRFLANPKCEVYVSFMWRAMQRFMSQPEFATPMDELFGTRRWRIAKTLQPNQRKEALHTMYRDQLKEAGANQVVYFQLFHGYDHKYSVFFGTSHTTGLDRMKKAIWKVAPWGDFTFWGGRHEQMVRLGLMEPDFLPLQQQLQENYVGKGWVTVENVLEFVRSDKTIYHDSQVKKPVLRPMEEQRLLCVDGTTRKRRYTYPSRCRIKFLSRGADPPV